MLILTLPIAEDPERRASQFRALAAALRQEAERLERQEQQQRPVPVACRWEPEARECLE